MHQIFGEKIAATRILTNEPMKNHTSIKIGGPADTLLLPECTQDILFAVERCKDSRIPYFIMGNGTNLLVSDKGIRGVVIKISKNSNNIAVDRTHIYSPSMVSLAALSKAAYEAGLSGLEFASGIPGSVGGAVFMNAGAYEREIQNVIVSAEILDPADMKASTYSRDEMRLGYRDSIFQHNGTIVLSAVFELKNEDKTVIRDKMNELNMMRREKQPLDLPSAGSAFKRPEGNFAAKLIMNAGLSGFSVGGAKVSEKHCGFIVNTGNASSEDVLRLIEHIKSTVSSRFGIKLEPEIRFVGEV